MVIFLDNKDYLVELAEFADSAGSQLIVLNLTSMYSGLESISNLVTNMGLVTGGKPTRDIIGTVEFDIAYANTILTTPEMFGSLMKIVLNSYEGKIVCVLVHRDEFRDELMESLIKLMQQRYGFASWIMDSLDDLAVFKEPDYSPDGLLNIEADLKMHDALVAAGTIPSSIARNSAEFPGDTV